MTKSLGIGGKGRYAFLLFDSTMKVVIFNPENEKLLIQILELLLPGKHISGITFTDKEKHGLAISEKWLTMTCCVKMKTPAKSSW